MTRRSADVYIRRSAAEIANMWIRIEERSVPQLKSPVMIVAVSTSLPQYRALYSQARELAKYMLSKMEFKPIATFHSSSFPPEVLVRQDGISTLPECKVQLSRGEKDVLLFSGDTSPVDDQYMFARGLLTYCNKLNVSEVYSVGARWTENPLPPESEPLPMGFSSDETGARRLKKQGVKLQVEEPAPFFASLIVGLAKDYGIRGYKLSVDHGEPSPHPRSVACLLRALSALVGFEAPLDDLRPVTKAEEVGQAPKPERNGIYR